jgi:LCP family protein required for cell wall assembly
LPQTILILGSDKRDTTEGDPGRSDTAILLRVDPEKDFLSLMSLPRDLEVPIPGYGTTKINAAYSYGQQEDPTGGGEALAIETVTKYLDIPINHVVNVDFGGFYEAVNAIDCVYIDVDRHYYNPTGGEYAEIDVEAGYQKLCGYKALQYVRYRHGDNDLVRGARQPDFIREARQRIPPGELLPFFGNGEEYIDIFTENTSSDIDNPATIVGMLKTFAAVRNAPVRQVSLGELSAEGGVVASSAEVDSAVDQFLGNDLDDAPEKSRGGGGGGGGGRGGGGDKPDKPKPDSQGAAPLVDFAGPAQEQAALFAKFMRHRKADLPIFYPTRLVQTTNTSISDESRAASLLGPNGNDIYQMYKYVIPFQESYGTQYYGFSGTNWNDPPILKNPSGTRTINGREFLLFYEQDKLRLVGWRTSKGSYWVNNTLSHALTEAQMLELAASTRELGG